MASKQETLIGTDGDSGVKLQTSFGGMQIVATKEPRLRDQVYLVVGGHISQVKEAGVDEEGRVFVTVTGQGQLITKDQYFALFNGQTPEGNDGD